MNVSTFTRQIRVSGISTITGIPDSTLRPFCDHLVSEGKELFDFHIVPENEGGCIGIAIGEYLATGRPACIYMQNSGLGNAVNPLTSLASPDVYGIPMLLIIGWRGELGTEDEPQHRFMGRITAGMLDLLEIPYAVIDKETTAQGMDAILADARIAFLAHKQFAILVKSGTFDTGTYDRVRHTYQNGNLMGRECAVTKIVKWLHPDDLVVSTTGKISRELYERADALLGSHEQIFLTVGGMGHACMAALQLAAREPGRKVVCVDGDGALLMHLGSMAVIGRLRPDNLVHICLDNEAHESVGGMPTGAAGLPFGELAGSCGYPYIYEAAGEAAFGSALKAARTAGHAAFIHARVSIGSRADLGRPRESARDNMTAFMRHNGVI